MQYSCCAGYIRQLAVKGLREGDELIALCCAGLWHLYITWYSELCRIGFLQLSQELTEVDFWLSLSFILFCLFFLSLQFLYIIKGKGKASYLI